MTKYFKKSNCYRIACELLPDLDIPEMKYCDYYYSDSIEWLLFYVGSSDDKVIKVYVTFNHSYDLVRLTKQDADTYLPVSIEVISKISSLKVSDMTA